MKKLNCQICVRVDGIAKTFSVSKPKGLTDGVAAEALAKLLKMVAVNWSNGEKCECQK